MNYRTITEKDDARIAAIVRSNLKAHGLDIPGTAYFDKELDHLSGFYLDRPGRAYIILADDDDNCVGGVGLAEFDRFENCAEMQKLYIADDAKGQGCGHELVKRIERRAKELGYGLIYIETHDALKAALHIYEKCGYVEIDKPEGTVHSTMNRFFIKEL